MGLAFNDTTNKLGLCQETDSICGSNSSTYVVADKTRRANSALDSFVSIALNSDDRWSFDDTNFTDLPIGRTNLVLDQRDYTFADDMLKILKVECVDSSGNWFELKPIDINDYSGPLDEIFDTSSTPQYYDKVASSIMMYPAANYNATLGLRVHYQRSPSYFAATDTTKQAGIPDLFHTYIALKMAEPFLRDAGKSNYTAVRNEIADYELNRIPEYYSKRDKDDKPIMVGKVVNSI